MAKVLNLTRNSQVKHSQAIRMVENCLAEWHTIGRSIRELDRTERLERFQAHTEHKRSICTYLPPIEPNGCKFIPPASFHTSKAEIRNLLLQARELTSI